MAERNGEIVAPIELRDSRQREYIEIPMPGGQTGRMPGRITGYVGIRFAQVADDALRDHLGQVVRRERLSETMDFDITLEDGTRIESCSIGGAQGTNSSRPATYWFTLDF